MEILAPSDPSRFLLHSPAPDAHAVERHFARRGQGGEFDMEARWIVHQVPPSANRILDLGCGIGALFPHLGIHRVVGMDYAHPGLRQTRRNFPSVPLACSDAGRLPLNDECLDAITVQHVIEHISDAQRTISEWSRVLRSGGFVIIVTPNAEFRDPAVFDDPTHVRLYDQVALRAELERGGFTTLKMLTLGLPWFRGHRKFPGGWRLRRAVLQNASMIARLPFLSRAGQSLCCVARKGECA